MGQGKDAVRALEAAGLPGGRFGSQWFPRRHSAARQISGACSGFAQFGAQHLNVAGGSDALAEP
jgi:hypothetical protein